jgi:DNA-binding GntR family transcriptional regulator
MHEELIQLLATATRITCARMTGPHRAALQASLDQACAVPAGLCWERKAAAHAEFLNALADTADDPQVARVLTHSAGLAYDLLIAAGRAADGIVINSRRRMLAHLRAGDADEAAYEMEKHLRVLLFMGRLAALPDRPVQRAAATRPGQARPLAKVAAPTAAGQAVLRG